MASRWVACALCALAAGPLTGCASPHRDSGSPTGKPLPSEVERVPASRFRPGSGDAEEADPAAPRLSLEAGPEHYVRYALYHSPRVEAAYERWLAASERLPRTPSS
jgi:hypothetical protein